MKGCYLEKWLLTSSVLYALFSSNLCAAQVVGDTTLPLGEQSQVTGNPNFQIDGGARRAGNLFHSFSEFSVPTGGTAFFNNAADIQNIFSRVIGASISNIDGLIRANGTANLFLINPNGIIFGENSRLNVGGSFVASTASSIKFADGTEFSAVNPSIPPLLTISVPIGLQFNGTEGDIVVRSDKPEPSEPLSSTNPFTEVEDAGQTLDTSQTVNSQFSGTSFDAISGTLSDNSDVDLYQLFLTEGQPFQATTLDGTDVDTQLFLFDATGLGLHSNDDSEGTLQSTVPEDQPFTPTVSGTYYLGISSYDNDPLSPLGNIFPNLDESPLSGWNGRGEDSGAYTINLTNSNRSTANNGTGLQVPAGQSLLLVGGDVGLEGGQIISPGSRVELGAVAGQGMVGLNGTAGDWRLSFPDGVARADVSLSNSAQINVRAGGGGSITVTAQNVTLSEGSRLLAGINDGLGFAGTQSGDIQLDAIDRIDITDVSFISNNVRPGGTGNAGNVNISARDTVSLEDISAVFNVVDSTGVGNAGNINITTGSLALTRGSQLVSRTNGQGNAGSVNINARDTVALDGENANTFSTSIWSLVGDGGVGNGAGINIQAQQLIVKSNAGLFGDVLPGGRGRGADINLDISGTILLVGGTDSGSGESARITLGVLPQAIGSGGNLRIRAGSLLLQDGGFIKASTQGQGDAGNIDIRADRVDISGSVPSNGLPSGLFTSSDTAGNAGDITIHTQTFRIADGAALSARSRGDGQGGDITVNAARSFEALNGGQLITTTFGQGGAGTITVNAGEQLTIIGSDPNYAERLARFPNPISPYVANAITETGAASGLFANTEPNSTGRGGDIQIATGQLNVQAGAQLITSTSGSGRAGDITVNAPDIQLSGANSGLFAQTTTSADAGDLTIQPLGNGQSVRVNLQDGAQISASTSSRGNGGELTITAPESITLTGNGSIIAAETGGSGTGGNLNLRTGTLNIQNQAEVTVSSEGTGSAGSLFVDADQIYLDNGGRIRADTSGGGGNINLRSPLIVLRNGSNITTNARGSDIPGGNINIDTDNLVAVPNEDSNITANSEDFRGGNVTVRASGIFGIEFREQPTRLSDITATGASSEFSGTVNLITPGIDPSRGLAELPTEVVDASDAITQGCRDVQGSSFVVTGRGGLPPTPQQALGDDPRWRDWRTPARVSRQPNTPANGTLPPSTNPPSSKSARVEATGWVFGADGKVMLTASAPNVTSPNRWGQPVNCDGS
ncbi:filamentous hemagglutinin N-terminal domain-containing protein [Coleofasciculus sp. FACHB-SPT9]|uniref:two-partner secretion domain-containing protein n=1 Tax=Coleofasciculus sp. FACHB-SPT9 TaxID=2692791 RepID=UPI001682CF11|nr:filamentous hemagglutinin N-terminal domain-containing protein [Coleofasciculus sp. FACHB-SPT9]MBD1889852.1 filamentous hemagglutinin N-terminal domain-containing protein [Coleofasciculus sp. FACHB-SPT9]